MQDGAKPPSNSFSITTRRPVAILMVVMAVCVFGWVSYQRLRMELMPDISYPTLNVRTEYPGSAPEEVETFISRPLEQELAVVPKLVSVSSVSQAGQSDIILEFEWDADMNAASQDIREKVDRVRLPEEAVKPLLLRYDPSLDPVVRIGLYGSATLLELRLLAEEEIKRALEAVSGVAAVKVKGGYEEEVHIALNERQMTQLGLDVAAINDRLARDNVNLPGGRLREGETQYLIRTLNEFRSLVDIGNVVVSRRKGAQVRLRDIATVERSYKEREVITRYNGRESVEIEIYKEADANIVAVAGRVADRLYGTPQQQSYVSAQQASSDSVGTAAESEEAEADAGGLASDDTAASERSGRLMTDFVSYDLPEGVQLETLSDRSRFIVDAVEEVQFNALVGGLMAIFVLFMFLKNITRALIIGITIPVSVVATFAPMHLFEVSLNIMSLGGMALGIGMLVDNSIVVLESIFRRREAGDSVVEATVRGTGEVGSAVVASTLTTIAVFFPIVFVEGVAGQVFGDMAMTVVFSLLASLVVALFFIPMLASRQLQESAGAWQKIRSSRFLRPPALEQGLSALTDSTLPTRVRVMATISSLYRILFQLVGRLGIAMATLIVAVLKFATLVGFETVWWLLKLLEYFWIRPARSFQEAMIEWSRNKGWGKLQFFEGVWPDILVFESVPVLVSDMRGLIEWLVGTGGIRFLLKCALMPAVVPYLILRFYLQSVLRGIGIVVHVALMMAALICMVAAFLSSAFLAPFLLPPLYLFGRAVEGLQRAYPVALEWALAHRLLVVGIAVAGLPACWLFLVPGLGRELIPQVHQGEFNLNISLPVGTPLSTTSRVLQQIEERVLAIDEVAGIATVVGSERTATSEAEEGEHTGRITVRLEPELVVDMEQGVIAMIREGLRDVPDADMEISRPTLFSFKTPVEVEIRGHDLNGLRQHGRAAELALAEVPVLVDVTSSLQTGNPELQIIYDRRLLAEYGLSLRRVADLVRQKVLGRVATDFRAGERNIDIVVRLRQDDRFGIGELKRLVVNPGGDFPVYLESIAEFAIREGPSEIRRIDQQRAVAITANVQGTDLGSATVLVASALERLELPSEFSVMISGQNQEMERSMESLAFALALAIFLVYIVMASQFESLIHPLIIMFSVPLAMVGAVVALAASGMALSIVVFIGFIMLAGIVVNNAIVLVDYINRLRRQGVERQSAIVNAATARLRPILMTTATTVLALLPMALGYGEGAEIRTPMALTVIAGLTSSTLLTLIVIPTVYSLVDRRR